VVNPFQSAGWSFPLHDQRTSVATIERMRISGERSAHPRDFRGSYDSYHGIRHLRYRM